MDKILRFMYFWSPPPSVPPGGHKGQLCDQLSCEIWKVDLCDPRGFLMKLHGCIPWSGPMVPIVLLPDTMNYVPLAAILNLLKLDFFDFC